MLMFIITNSVLKLLIKSLIYNLAEHAGLEHASGMITPENDTNRTP